MLAHIVFFTLKDHSPEACQRMVAACQNHLTAHPGTIHFSAGLRAPQYQREVNDRDYHVGLHLVFESHEAHDAYQVHPRHKQFIAENKDNWAKVRVFDSDV
jgi:hypothetical protein